MTTLEALLASYRTTTVTERDKGTAFEKLVQAWLVTDPVQARRFERVQLWTDWAHSRGQDRRDTGIDLVGTLRDGGLAAIQCKFVEAQTVIRKAHIDSFISASAKPDFAQRLIVETSAVPWSPQAETTLRGQAIPVTRIGLQDLLDSPVDWSAFAGTGEITRPAPKTLRPDQKEALGAVRAGLEQADRGKLIMACGTGKTLTALRVAEELAGVDRHVLFLMPSLALMAQSVREWCADAVLSLTTFAVCSDAQVGKRRRSRDDAAELEVTDLAFPATTDAMKLARAVARAGGETMRVIFATYQSIEVIAQAQADHGLPQFDLIVCDEAHRTTGATFPGEDQSNFVKVHDNHVIRGCKRLYMTATPRIYGEGAKSKAKEVDAVLASMDDEGLYGRVLFHHSFARAVESDILTDYRVIVLAMDEGHVSASVQQRLSDESSELVLDDATKIIGCWKALSKAGLELGPMDDPEPMRRALAFCRDIKSSKLIRDEFEQVVQEFQAETDGEDGNAEPLVCEVQHVDSTHNARSRGQRLDWLKDDADGNVCRILSNARCLAEGVDVPALDAILFLHPRNSQVDVVQSVGRVMRKAPGKRMGYVILPVGVPAGVEPEQALNDNQKYRVVWQVLNALRAHDERLDAVINQGSLGQDVSDRITIIDGRADSASLRAVTVEVSDLPTRPQARHQGIGEGHERSPRGANSNPQPLTLVIDEFSRAIMAKIVEKCGTRDYWEDWATDVAEIADRHITRITALVETPGSDAEAFFQDFLTELRDDLNEAVSERDAIEMLAQHLITRPVFEALFEGHDFVDRNPVSSAMQEILEVIDEAQISREAEKLEGFYASVRRRASGITDPQARQRLIVELYDKFFRGAFPRTTQRLGIVYTPVEIVDFIIHSVNEALQAEFGQALGSPGIHIIDPFVGTGTFLTRLLQSGLIAPEDLERKYRQELHANELVLLAYYIAAINIETVFHSLAGRDEYMPFEGICLTDTFALHEGGDLLSSYLKDNSDRREQQKETDIRVIIGNPPYSAGQRRANDNAQNVAYAGLDRRIAETYATGSVQTSVKNLYDSYIRAIRWGSDRLGEAGVMAYVSGSAWIERAFADGMRKRLADEFASVHVFHLRGDIRKNMLSGGKAGEGGNVFGQGSMTGAAITIFVKNQEAKKQGRIFFHDIGDYLDQKQKLDIVQNFGSIGGIDKAGGWTRITPDMHGDWLNQRDDSFEAFLKIGDKKDGQPRSVLFGNYSIGVATGRDAWCINPSRTGLASNIEATIRFYNEERTRWVRAKETGTAPAKIADLLDLDPKRISWSVNVRKDLERDKPLDLEDGLFVPCVYRPFTKQWQFYSRRLNERVYQMPRIFPNAHLLNRVIAVTGKGGRSGFSALMLDTLPSLDTIEKGQCFPFWLYEEAKPEAANSMFPGLEDVSGFRRHEAITEYGLEHFRRAYPGEDISREDIFHYVYGLLHSEDYRARFRDNLAKDLPRIPCVKAVEDFRAFRDAGQRLGELHVGYEKAAPYPAVLDTDDHDLTEIADPAAFFRVVKMRHPGSGQNKDRSIIIYNSHITVRDIPEAAWEYAVNGKPALAWVMGRQTVRTDNASGIVSDANRYAIETVGDPRYPLDLLLRIITVSLETMKIVRGLPELGEL